MSHCGTPGSIVHDAVIRLLNPLLERSTLTAHGHRRAYVMGDNSALAAKFEEVLRTNDFGKMIEVTKEYSTDDFHTDWPQSGERLGKEAAIRMSEQYAEMSGTQPAFTYKRMLGGGDV
jgi:hypothetical protein